MDSNKIRNLNAEELKNQERQSAEQLFRIRFQMKLGQNEGVKKLRSLRKDIARLQTIARERELGLRGTVSVQSQSPVKAAESSAPKKAKSARTAKKEAR